MGARRAARGDCGIDARVRTGARPVRCCRTGRAWAVVTGRSSSRRSRCRAASSSGPRSWCRGGSRPRSSSCASTSAATSPTGSSSSTGHRRGRLGSRGAGVVLHEGQLSYPAAGLVKCVDLGEWWRERPDCRCRSVSSPCAGTWTPDRGRGVRGLPRLDRGGPGEPRGSAALCVPPRPRDRRRTLDRFVAMYVNDLSVDMGDEGRRAVDELLHSSGTSSLGGHGQEGWAGIHSPGPARPLRDWRAARSSSPRSARLSAATAARSRAYARTTSPPSRSRRRSSAPASTRREIEDVYFGCANQAGEDNRNVARMAALLAGLPESVAGVTLNRLCASGSRRSSPRVPRGRRRRRRPLRRRRRRVDEPRAARDARSRTRRSRAATGRCTTRRSAGASRTRGSRSDVPARVDGRDGRERRRALGRLARGSGRVRARVAAALGGGRRGGRFDDELVAVGRRRRATSTRAPTRAPRSSPR